MKKTIILTFIFLIVATMQIFAQEIGVLETRGISTDPDNPQNPENPELINTLDWREPDYNSIYFRVEKYTWDKSPFDNQQFYNSTL